MLIPFSIFKHRLEQIITETGSDTTASVYADLVALEARSNLIPVPRVDTFDAEKAVVIYGNTELYDYFKGVKEGREELNIFTLSRMYVHLKKVLKISE